MFIYEEKAKIAILAGLELRNTETKRRRTMEFVLYCISIPFFRCCFALFCSVKIKFYFIFLKHVKILFYSSLKLLRFLCKNIHI